MPISALSEKMLYALFYKDEFQEFQRNAEILIMRLFMRGKIRFDVMSINDERQAVDRLEELLDEMPP